MKDKKLNLYRVRFDGSDTFVEAGTMSAAIKVWHGYATKALDVDEDAEPEEVALLESDDEVLRDVDPAVTGDGFAGVLRSIVEVCNRDTDPATGVKETSREALAIVSRIADAALGEMGRA